MGKSIREILDSGKKLVIDGALATELEARGCDINDELWSARILLERPDLIKQIHLDYFKAGANVAITASYQASPLGLQKYREMDSAAAYALIRNSVALAREARNEYVSSLQPDQRPSNTNLFIAGSVGPYGAFLADGSEYTGAYELSREAFVDFHKARVQALVDGGVDILAFETIPSFYETLAILDVIRDFPEVPAWVAFSLKDEHHISDGTPLSTVCDHLNSSSNVIAVGVNCVSRALVTPALRMLRQSTQKALLAYPNSGEIWNSATHSWNGTPIADSDRLPALLMEWTDAGAVMIGGCCRTGPQDIAIIRSHTSLA